MSNPNPLKSNQWKPGQSGNPSGKPKQLLTQDKVSSILGKFCHFTRNELQNIVRNPDSTMIEVMVASIMARAAKDGDYSRLEFLLMRSIGRVKDSATPEGAHLHISIEQAKEILNSDFATQDPKPLKPVEEL